MEYKEKGKKWAVVNRGIFIRNEKGVFVKKSYQRTHEDNIN